MIFVYYNSHLSFWMRNVKQNKYENNVNWQWEGERASNALLICILIKWIPAKDEWLPFEAYSLTLLLSARFISNSLFSSISFPSLIFIYFLFSRCLFLLSLWERLDSSFFSVSLVESLTKCSDLGKNTLRMKESYLDLYLRWRKRAASVISKTRFECAR